MESDLYSLSEEITFCLSYSGFMLFFEITSFSIELRYIP